MLRHTSAGLLFFRKLNRVPGLGSGAQMVEEWGPEDCEEYQKRSIKCRDQNRCSPEAKCPLGAIFVEDASFALSDLYGVDKAGTKYHVIHSLFTVVTVSNAATMFHHDISTHIASF